MSVYFAERDGLIKIGCSREPRARCHSLGARLIGFTDGTFADEKQWHHRFAKERVEGEWFHPSLPLLVAIDETIGESDDESDDEDPQAPLFSKLIGTRAPKALALAQDDGSYAYRAFGFCTHDELTAAEKVRRENVSRAQARLDDLIAKHDQLTPYLTDASTTVLDALRAMPDPETDK